MSKHQCIKERVFKFTSHVLTVGVELEKMNQLLQTSDLFNQSDSSVSSYVQDGGETNFTPGNYSFLCFCGILSPDFVASDMKICHTHTV